VVRSMAARGDHRPPSGVGGLSIERESAIFWPKCSSTFSRLKRPGPPLMDRYFAQNEPACDKIRAADTLVQVGIGRPARFDAV
jgi:hypothetical protein